MILQAAAVLLIGAMLLGIGLLSANVRPAAARAAHGLLGGAGVAATAAGLAWLQSTPPALLLDGAVLALAALLLGLLYWRFGGRLRGARLALLALHAFAGATGATLLTAWAFGG